MEEKIEISLTPNYTLTVASNETLALIYNECSGKKYQTKEIVAQLEQGLFPYMDELTVYLRDYNGAHKDKLKVRKTHNKIPNIVRYELAKLFTGNPTATTFNANYLALGTGSTAPANTDIKLNTETVRGGFTQRTYLDNTAFLDKFFSSAEVGGQSFFEVGVFCDGTATTDSGFLLSRALTNISISSSETLTINVTLTLNSAT